MKKTLKNGQLLKLLYVDSPGQLLLLFFLDLCVSKVCKALNCEFQSLVQGVYRFVPHIFLGSFTVVEVVCASQGHFHGCEWGRDNDQRAQSPGDEL